MSILKKHIKSRIRKELPDNILIYNPSFEEKQKISKKLEETAKLQTNENGLFAETGFDEIEMFKFLASMLTNIEDIQEEKDEEILRMFEYGDETIEELRKEFKDIIEEITKKYIENLLEQIDTICELLKNEESLNKLDEVLKSKNLNMQDLIYLSRQEDELKKELAKSKVTPQDHKKPQPKKRGRKKKVVENIEEVKIDA